MPTRWAFREDESITTDGASSDGSRGWEDAGEVNTQGVPEGAGSEQLAIIYDAARRLSELGFKGEFVTSEVVRHAARTGAALEYCLVLT